jgi:DNA processing protein
LTRNALLHRSPADFLSLSEQVLREEYAFSKSLSETWLSSKKELVTFSQQLLERLESDGVEFATVMDSHFPVKLEEFYEKYPSLLFLYGNSKLLLKKNFSVLSSRNSSVAALNQIEKVAEEGVLKGEILVSGHDTKEYQRSAVVPLRWGSPRILVIDRGFYAALGQDLSLEPFRAARLWRHEFDPNTDLAISAINPLHQTHRSANQMRDHIIAGLSDRHDFIQVNPGGNMERLLYLSLQSDRPTRVSELNLDYREYAAQGCDILKV